MNIQEHQAIFKIEGYKKKAMPEVLNYLKEAKKRINNKTVFNAELTSEIMGKENLPEEDRDYIETEVYLAQHDLRQEEEDKHKEEMLSQGWKILNAQTEYEGKCLYVATKTSDWLTSKLENTGTIKKLDNGELFLFPKGKRTRGYYVRNLENAFYQAI